MKKASQAFGRPQANQLDTLTGNLPVPTQVQQVALAFVELQEARHEADYNTAKTFTRLEVTNLVARVAQAFQSWQAIRTDPVARMYLASMLLGKKWTR